MKPRIKDLDGRLFHYVHTRGEPAETLEMAMRVACTIAEGAAINTGKNHVVARTIKPKSYSVFAADNPALKLPKMVPVYAITPDSACVQLEPLKS